MDNFGHNNDIVVGDVRGGKIRLVIRGDNCKINISNIRIRRNLTITINQSHSTLSIGPDCILEGSIDMSQGGHIAIGREVTAQQFSISSQEGRNIIIGDHCMFGRGVQIRNSDAHSIFDVETGKRINHPADTFIAAHVWGAHGSSFFKGAVVGRNSVVGAGATVMIGEYPEGAILVGTPARVIRTGIIWDRWFADSLDSPELSDYLSKYLP